MVDWRWVALFMTLGACQSRLPQEFGAADIWDQLGAIRSLDEDGLTAHVDVLGRIAIVGRGWKSQAANTSVNRLYKAHDPAALGYLVEALATSNRETALASLGAMNSRRACDVLAEAWQDELAAPPHPNPDALQTAYFQAMAGYVDDRRLCVESLPALDDPQTRALRARIDELNDVTPRP